MKPQPVSYPGQEYWHAMNPNIRRAEENWEGKVSEGTMACPICGIARPHQHTTTENNLLHDARILHSILVELLPVTHSYHYDSQRSYGGRAMACNSCDEINDNHKTDCYQKLRIEKLEEVLKLIKSEELKLSNRK